MHYYKFNISDWRSSTSHLSLEEEAIYLRLINYYYAKESIIPLDLTLTLRKLSLINHNDLVLVILDEFFTKTDQGWKKNKCDEILKEYKKTAGKNKKNGAKGGRPSKAVAFSITQEKPTGLIMETQTKPTGNPNQEPLTKNHKPILKDLDQSKIDPDELNFCFDQFWQSGIRKVNKKKCKPIFIKSINNQKLTPCDFTSLLVKDIRLRISSNQLGFDLLHPTTYLAGERWNDEITQEANNHGQRNEAKFETTVDRYARQSRELQARENEAINHQQNSTSVFIDGQVVRG